MNGFLRNYPSLSAPLTSTAQVAEGRKFPAAPADAFSLEFTHTSTLLHTHDVAMRPTTTRISDTNPIQRNDETRNNQKYTPTCIYLFIVFYINRKYTKYKLTFKKMSRKEKDLKTRENSLSRRNYSAVYVYV